MFRSVFGLIAGLLAGTIVLPAAATAPTDVPLRDRIAQAQAKIAGIAEAIPSAGMVQGSGAESEETEVAQHWGNHHQQPWGNHYQQPWGNHYQQPWGNHYQQPWGNHHQQPWGNWANHHSR